MQERVYAANLSSLSAATQAALSIASAIDVKAEAPDYELLVATPAGAWVPVHPSGDPAAASVALIARLSDDGPPPLVAVIGLGSGFLLDALEATGNTTTKILAIEPVPALTRVLLIRRDCRDWLSSGRLTLVVGPDYAGAAEAWRAFDSASTGTPPAVTSPLIAQHFPQEAGAAKAALARILSGVQANAEARRQFAGRYLVNTFRNLPALVDEGDAASLTGAFDGVPAIIVGAGPSLDANLPTIEALQHRALLIAVDTAVRPLVAAGIRPHITVAVDPSELNARHLQNLPNVSDVWFVAEASLDPSVFRPFGGRTFAFHVSQHEPWPWLADHEIQRGALRAWGSVLTTCFDLAGVMGCDPIVFAGADLAFSRGLQYCRNTTYESDWRDCADDAARAERFKQYLAVRPHRPERDVHGQDVLTSPSYVHFRDWILARAAELRRQRVWNITGDGILWGGAIEQVADADVRLAGKPLLRAVGRRFRELWSARRTSSDVKQRLAAALSDSATLPLDRWRAFGGANLDPDELNDTIARAAEIIDARARAAVVVQRDRDVADGRLASVGHAAGAMHPRYAFACMQAPAQLAHALLEVMQRTYAMAPAAPVLDVVEAATRVTPGLRILDVGCGLGRTMLPLVEAGYHVDGVDVSGRVLEFAQRDSRLAASSFFQSSGMDCGDAPEGAYDLACAFHAFHQVRPRAARLSLLQAIARALRPGGVLLVQLPFFPDRTASTVPAPHVAWSAEHVDELDRGGVFSEVHCTPDELPLVYDDFASIFRDVTFRFVDFPAGASRFGLAASHRLAHLVVSASNDFAVAPRMYAPLELPDSGV